MQKDLFAEKVEKAIFNWYYGGEEAEAEPVFNEIALGLQNGMQVIVPVEKQNEFSTDDKKADRETNPVCINTDEIQADSYIQTLKEAEGYYIPVFTSENEFSRGKFSFSAEKALKNVLTETKSQETCLGVIINTYGKRLVLLEEMIELALNYKAESHLSIIRGSVVDMHVGAIVNAANKTLLGGGGVDGAIHRAAGIGLLNECRKLNGCKTGEAKITGAYNLKNADFIIHTVGPVYHGTESDAELLTDCYRNSLDIALRNDCTSIAFPCISTGVYGYPIREAAAISAKTVLSWMNIHSDKVMNVYFCCFKNSEYDAYMEILKQS